MASNVCIDNDSLQVDETGRLSVKLDPGSTCEPNQIEVSASGLTARRKIKHLRRFHNMDELSAGNVANVTQADPTAATNDNGTAAGIWTVNGDGTITIHCDGVYMFSCQFVLTETGGVIFGGHARITNNGGIVASQEIIDSTATIHLGTTSDGPEFNCAATRILNNGDVLAYVGQVNVTANGLTCRGYVEFAITYLGEFA